MKSAVFQIDTFTDRVLGGNPAVIVCVSDWPDDATLLAVAQEHNAPTTAFLREAGEAFDIRYFLSIGELPLVGHASLAAAHVVLKVLRPGLASATLKRRTGTLQVSADSDGRLAITLSASPAQPCAMPAGLERALGANISGISVNGAQYFALLDNAADVARIAPDMDTLMRLDRDGLVVTARGDDCDFVSRAFAPKEGLPEDPVCGSAHLALVPYWAERLGKHRLHARQLSPRGGELHCTLEGDAVRLAGRCAVYMEGTIGL